MDEQSADIMGIVPALVRGSFLIERVYADAAREHSVTPQQGVLLCVLMPGPLGMTELSGVLRLAKSSLTGLVNRTEANGFVVRSADPTDTRAVVVSLTASGASVAQEFYDETCRRIDALTHTLSSGERAALASLLGRVVVENEVPVVFVDTGGR